ncbi:MAG TPA: type II secretion system protein N [Gammaproteobacteria bacterium]|nr:type II secretion system protein N [Gammaproteobacteria bacterium]
MIALPMPRLAFPPLAFAVVGAAVLALGWRDWQRLENLAPMSSGPSPAPTETARDALPAASRAALDRLPLFGSAESSAAQAAPPPAPIVEEAALPESTAGYQLFGIIEADVPSAARAIVGTADGEQREYRVGDTMPDGARVHAVRERAVIFERDAQLERLALPAADAASAANAGVFARNRLPGANAPGFIPATPYAAPEVTPPPDTFVPMPPTEVPPPAAEAGPISP